MAKELTRENMTKLMARRINASLMQEAIFIDKPGTGVTSESWVAACAGARDLGVALYANVVSYAKWIDPSFDAPIGTFEAPLIASK
jgi:hypothetical protein